MSVQRVLVIDDQASMLALLKVLLERTLPGADVMTADSASVGLTLLRDRPCDLVLSDVNMPGQGGLFVLNQVKRQWPSVPVVLMSGTPLIDETLAAGADGFLPKPFTIHQLTETLTGVVSGKRNAIGSQIDLLA
jgi:DNA-binding NarL/FixJ family response regulator